MLNTRNIPYFVFQVLVQFPYRFKDMIFYEWCKRGYSVQKKLSTFSHLTDLIQVGRITVGQYYVQTQITDIVEEDVFYSCS